MIKANELRENIWVVIDGKNEQLDQDALEVIFASRNYSDLTPIPLTPEILEKAGFDKTGYKKVDEFAVIFINLERKEFTLCSSEAPTSSYGYWGGGLEYLHQLQNLYFALTGEELTVNFKELTYQ